MYLPDKLFQLMNLTLKILLGDIQVTLSIRTLMISIYKYFPWPKNVKRPRNVHITYTIALKSSSHLYFVAHE